MRVRYFALLGDGRDVSRAYNIFREVLEAHRYTLERLDAGDPNRWVIDKELGGYMFKGELGAQEITEEEARRFVEQRGGKFTPPA